MSDIIEGRNPVLELLKAGRSINKILIADNVQRHSVIAEILNLAKTKDTPVEFVDETVIRRLSFTAASQGIIAYVSPKEYVTLDDLLAISKSKNEATAILYTGRYRGPAKSGSYSDAQPMPPDFTVLSSGKEGQWD